MIECKKYLVIDSLARSGTTLLSSLIRSQQSCMTINGLFLEPMSCHEFQNLPWPHGYAQHKIEARSTLDLNHLKAKSCEKLRNSDRLRCGFELNFWNDILSNDFKNADEVYNHLANHFKARCFGLRWNQCLFYQPCWMRSENHFGLLSSETH